MSVTSATLRLALRSCVVLTLWLASVSAGHAMPAAQRSSAKFCDAQTTSIRKLVRQARAVGGPLARRLRHGGIRLNSHSTGIGIGSRGWTREDEQAIQNDAPAPPLTVDHEIELRSTGVFTDSVPSLLTSRTLSPQSPRGPPDRASHGFRSVGVWSNRGDSCEWHSQT
jgi:hypothetical protein